MDFTVFKSRLLFAQSKKDEQQTYMYLFLMDFTVSKGRQYLRILQNSITSGVIGKGAVCLITDINKETFQDMFYEVFHSSHPFRI